MISADEHKAFMAAILAAPKDDLPRLVYADRLDEDENPLGEFIRVQIELARLPQGPFRPCGSLMVDINQEKRDGLHLREVVLWREGIGLGPLCDYGIEGWWLISQRPNRLPARTGIVSRGLLGEVCLPWSEWRAGPGVFIRSVAPIEHVVLTTLPDFEEYEDVPNRCQVVRVRHNGRQAVECVAQLDIVAGGRGSAWWLGRKMLETCLSKLWEGVTFDVSRPMAVAESQEGRQSRSVYTSTTTY